MELSGVFCFVCRAVVKTVVSAAKPVAPSLAPAAPDIPVRSVNTT